MGVALSASASSVPLVVDVDGTLIRTDLLYEAFLDTVGLGTRHVLAVAQSLAAGKAALKRFLAERSGLAYETLPYDPAVLDLVRSARAEGRPVYLATAGDRLHAEKIMTELGLFDGVYASDGRTNLSGDAKADKLAAEFGEQGFDYVGNDAADLPVWRKARRAYGIRLVATVKARLAKLKPDWVELSAEPASLSVWAKAIRVHQWSKNLLVFVPLITAHHFGLADFAATLVAFAAFSLCASSVYLVNDMVDLKADRAHPTKRNRPLAAGRITIAEGAIAAAVLLAVSAGLALLVSPVFLMILALYYLSTLAYSFVLKRKLMADVIVLAGLYGLRVFAGAVAIGVFVSEWLFAFSILFFTALALVKRHVELSVLMARGFDQSANRGYRVADRAIVLALAAAAGMNAVTIFAFYVSTPTVAGLYTHPQILWLICPILLYWIGRVLMMAGRGDLDDDPIVFAIRDRNSWAAAAFSGACILAAL